jgi:hypothetical protein
MAHYAHYGALRALYAARFFSIVGGRSGMEIGEIVTDLLGRVISFTALHLGDMNDATIWSLGKHLRPTLVGEYGLGDRIYSPCPDLITDFCQLPTKGRVCLHSP